MAEHVHLLRLGLSACLDREPDIHVVADLSHGDGLASAVATLCPTVAVIDVDLPGPAGSTGVAHLRELTAECSVVMLADRGDPMGVRRAMTVDPLGLLSRQAPADVLMRVVRQVAAGRRMIDPELAGTARAVEENPLTPRELEVLRIAANGATTAEIAARLSLSVKTVRNHLSSVITRTAARNRIDAIRIASERAWL
ncbi:LuxR C-terminal-related transcriptional regulator [Actinoallomurus rhizosphaericola]|uniref:LuxR C-terminal-related transcriptional regulator n=1 Tax=Actinoallomurus rhizosphaericola TaxID=2952536 RepID=UPI002092BEB7|nr:response regulator transcription factor [Actinoallomurus rhizosphaericola]MCO5998518.1 response regulator transcription factor [Actinoallomurus rhizosphaericola]